MKETHIRSLTASLKVSPAEDVDCSSSDESESEAIAPTQDASQRRLIQKARFEASPANHALTCDEKVEVAVESQLSTAQLISSKGQPQGTLDPREYQIELFERAKTHNTIAVLATSMHAARILALTQVPLSKNELNYRMNGEPRQMSFFLVDSVTLSYQQAGVLRNNFDVNVGHIFGALGPDLWSRQTWTEFLEKYMVVVCTAEVLYQCLLQARIRMEQINLLVFNKPITRRKIISMRGLIIRDSYFPTAPSKRPRILNMTASPVDTKGDVAESAMNLESYLDSKIATASQLSLVHKFVRRPKEEAWIHGRVERPFGTELYSFMEGRFGDIEDLKPCSDGVWKHVFSAKMLPQLEEKSKELSRLRDASEIASSHTLGSPDEPGQSSHKVQVLRKRLAEHYRENPETRLFNALEIPHLRPGLLIGAQTDDFAGPKISCREQFLAIDRFRNGEINCLFATSVGEEGLDIPACNLVIRFDLSNTMIRYVQSRGRARQVNSTYASLVEKDNQAQRQRLLEVQDAETNMQVFCEPLPKDRILKGNDGPVVSSCRNEAERAYTIESSGARLTYHSALVVLAKYASSLQYEGGVTAQVPYAVLPTNNTFVCEVILPERSPIRGLTGTPASNKSTAKRSAAFDTCVLHRKHRLLGNHFNPTNKYDMIQKPALWARDRGIKPRILYATVITFKPTKPLARELASIIFLTRERLPELPGFSIYLEEYDVETIVGTSPVEKAWAFSEPETMPYWLVPASTQAAAGARVYAATCIDWDTVAFGNSADQLAFSENTSSDIYCNRLIPSDPPPSSAPRRRYMNNIMNYCVSLSRNSRASLLVKCNWNQPVFRAEMADQEKGTKTGCFVSSCLVFPAVATRLDRYLTTLEACRKLDLNSDNTEEYRAQQIQVQKRMGEDNEHLEFLGGCFLKMTTSISLFAQNPNNNEFDSHVKRMCLICNKNLFNTAIKKEIYWYIRSRAFSRHTWYPEGLSLLKDKDHSKKLRSLAKHSLAEKKIADVCEALIGAFLLSGGTEHRFDMAVKAVTILVDNKACCWKDYTSVYNLPPCQIEAATVSEEQLALTRLEFLGDALLDMVCVEDLFARYPSRDPQWLTEHKFLGALAIKLELHKHLIYFSNPLMSQINKYAEDIKAAVLERKSSVDYWTSITDPPMCLPDMVEAYLGAIFIDSNFNFSVVEEFYHQYVQPFFYDMTVYDTSANKHPTIPVVDGETPHVLAAVMIHNTIVAEGISSSGRTAKIKANEKALDMLERLSQAEFREKFKCDCPDAENPPEADLGTAI
ncbi:putative RNA helicase/RNAse III [Aspergillus foveolatus]|uniref:putative RNA helicase/RNAse III n=1 Tax=Aspergillus foveolatus TaxID=210207 RepID=UPI003CCE0F23